MSAFNIPLFIILIGLFSIKAQAGLVFTIAETGGNVRIEYSGTLNLSGIASSTSASISERNIRQLDSVGFSRVTLNNVPTLPSGRFRNYSNPFSSMPPDYLSVRVTPAASSFGGTTISLVTFFGTLPAGALNGLSFDANDVVNNTWTGSGFLQWNNRTIAELGIDPSPKLWVLNNATADSITMTQLITAVPEPSSFVFCAAAVMVGMLMFGKRKQVF